MNTKLLCERCQSALDVSWTSWGQYLCDRCYPQTRPVEGTRVAITYDAAEVLLYVNGQLMGGGAISLPIETIAGRAEFVTDPPAKNRAQRRAERRRRKP